MSNEQKQKLNDIEKNIIKKIILKKSQTIKNNSSV